MIPSTLKNFIFSQTFFFFFWFVCVLGSFGSTRTNGVFGARQGEWFELLHYPFSTPTVCSVLHPLGGGGAAIRAGILFPLESEVLGIQSLFPIAPHLIHGGGIISMAGGLEWRDRIRVDTKAWLLASIQLQSEEIIPLLRTLWDAPWPELRLHFCFPCLIRFYSNPCKHNWCKHPQNNHSYENIWLKNPYHKKMVKSRKYLIHIKENDF